MNDFTQGIVIGASIIVLVNVVPLAITIRDSDEKMAELKAEIVQRGYAHWNVDNATGRTTWEWINTNAIKEN